MHDWECVMREQGPAVWRVLHRILGNRADVEECFQETFLSALQATRDQAVQHWGALLKRLATARAMDRLRQRYRKRTIEPPGQWTSIPSSDPRPPELAEASELSESLRQALSEIPQKQAEVFCLHCIEGLSYDEIASGLSMSIDAVGVTLHRARHRLRELLPDLVGSRGSKLRGGQ